MRQIENNKKIAHPAFNPIRVLNFVIYFHFLDFTKIFFAVEKKIKSFRKSGT